MLVSIRVLIADDAADVRHLVRTALRLRTGFDVIGEAEDGRQAVHLAATLQPDIVVLDLGLPDLAGQEVLTDIRHRSPASKVVVFSGNETTDRSSLAEQVEGYVPKSADLSYLIDLLEALGHPPGHQAVLPLQREPENVGRARDFVRGVLLGWGRTDLTDDALVVVSELVTNAITHARSTCELRLSSHQTTVRIEVVDHGAGTPDPQRPGVDEEHGRGLYLVGALTTAWGVQVTPEGAKVVWAELLHTAARPILREPG